ncbi:MAG: hypothetical protein WBZ15_25515 [Mycobacterium sp.]|uniref:hypothetical protein n=1 Tax=Mycobacterium sp. TaxID=1785 RepID=UPI003C577CFE
MPGVAVLPGLSELLAWPTDHLTEGAAYWEAVAGRWYEAFTRVWQESLSADWKGEAADALRARTYADKLQVSSLVDQLQEGATVARQGASDLSAARSRVRYAVDVARAAGFEVGEHLSVTDRSAGGTAARHVQADVLAAEIRGRAVHLIAVDQRVAGGVSGALGGIRSVGFAEAAASTEIVRRPPLLVHNEIQPVDNLQQDSRQQDGQGVSDGPNLIYCYPSARPDHWWCEGYEEGKGPYAFFSPFDTSGVA